MKKWLPFLGVLVLILAVADYLAFEILSELMFKGESAGVIIIREIIMYLAVGLGGVYALNKIPEEMFFQPTERTKKIATTLGMAFIVANSIFYIISVTKFSNDIFVNILQDNLFGALGIAIRSGITEELLFRFFLINSILFIGSGLIGNPRRLKITAIIISAIAFIFIHPLSTALVTLVAGLVLGYIYFELGLISAIIVHTLGNLIPFILIALKIVS